MRAPYGTWNSPITAESITRNVTAVTEATVDPTTSIVYHIEGRPSEAGRNVLVESRTGRDVPGRDWDVRTGVYEYGGAPATVYNGQVYFSNIKDNRVYKVDAKGGTPEPVTPEKPIYRYAQICVHPSKTNLLVSVFEDHTIDEPSKVVNTICLINTDTKTVSNIITGSDFYAFPIFSPDGTKLAWQQWSNPHMPWEESQILIADVSLGGTFKLSNVTTIAAETNVSFSWLSWASEGTLLFISDKSGFSNPWRYDVSTKKSSPIFPEPVEEDFSNVMWSMGYFPYAVVDQQGKNGVFAAWRDGRNILYLVNLENGSRQELASPYVTVESMRTVSREKNQVVFIGGRVDEFQAVVQCTVTLGTSASPEATFETLNPPGEVPFSKDLISVPEGKTLDSSGQPLHVIFYPPYNPDYEGSSVEGEKPPCVLNVHGGPTGMAFQNLQSKIQYFTTRGWAWLDVNYGGSFGYGRAYRDRLNGQWGPLDTEDCITAARLLATDPYNYIDSQRTVIRGSSSGGLTVLTSVSLSSNLDAFAAATSLYGVADLVSLMAETHKFEAHYMQVPGTPEEQEAILKSRSPVNFADKIRKPVLFLHGDADRVVPLDQAQKMHDNIINAGGTAELKIYPGEGHGFRQEANQKDALERELDFYERYLELKK